LFVASGKNVLSVCTERTFLAWFKVQLRKDIYAYKKI
jgi:hypothetical protein